MWKGLRAMGKLTVDGLSQLSLSMKEIQEIPDDVTRKMLHAQADVVVKAQKEKGLEYGVHRTGVTLASIKKGRVKKDEWEKYINVTPQGKNAKGRPNTEVAFVNEFGKHGQAPRPFIREANEECADEAVAASEKVFNKWLDSKGL